MYPKCRHIKPNGLRCESSALRGTHFCYLRSKLHSLGNEPYDKLGSVRLPTLEGSAAVLLSLAQIDDALINAAQSRGPVAPQSPHLLTLLTC